LPSPRKGIRFAREPEEFQVNFHLRLSGVERISATAESDKRQRIADDRDIFHEVLELTQIKSRFVIRLITSDSGQECTIDQPAEAVCCAEMLNLSPTRGRAPMKHILLLVSIALPLICGADIAMAFVPGLPPLSGPGSVFHGNPEVAPKQKSESKKKKKSGSRLRQVLPKQSQ
jgi:hypothetical protein